MSFCLISPIPLLAWPILAIPFLTNLHLPHFHHPKFVILLLFFQIQYVWTPTVDPIYHISGPKSRKFLGFWWFFVFFLLAYNRNLIATRLRWFANSCLISILPRLVGQFLRLRYSRIFIFHIFTIRNSWFCCYSFKSNMSGLGQLLHNWASV